LSEKAKKIKAAKDAFMQGYNCAQSTALPFCSEVGIDEKTLLNVSVAFGGGVARLREVCGVVSGIAIIVGLKENRDYSNPESKKDIYVIAQDLIKKFEAKNNTINCGELLEIFDKSPIPSERTDAYYQDRPCARLVEDGAEILCDYFAMV
jgi:C_GCAxxG_C_C family probable redox protein